MRFDWDPEKAGRNLARHGVSFELAAEVWNDPSHVIVPDQFEGGDDEDRVRIIGARKATAHERRRYEHQGA